MMTASSWKRFFPLYCHICSKRLLYGDIVCDSCEQKIKQQIQFTSLIREDLTSEFNHLYSFIDYHQANSMGMITKIKKYNDLHLLQKILSWIRFPHLNISKIVYIPASFRKYLERGYNPAKEIAKCVSEYYKVPIEKYLSKKDSLSQIFKTREQRLARKHSHTFRLRKRQVPEPQEKPLSILLVDDVITTGATLSHAAHLIRPNLENSSIQFIGMSLFHTEIINPL